MYNDGQLSLTWDGSFEDGFEERLKKAQEYVDETVIDKMIPYTPMRNGVLQSSVRYATKIGSGKIEYAVPYDRYQYYGKLMVSSVTGSPYARKGEKKVLTDVDLKYSTFRHPLAGAFWFERMKKDHLDEIRNGAAAILGGSVK